MRNLKKVLTLVLTLAMLLSVMVVGAGAATFNDQDSITNDEAVDMCVALNIIGGYEDGTFRPTGNVTRAEMSKMICVALNGGKEPTMGSNLIATFNDVASTDWSAPYVEYCVSQGIVGGVGGGNFNPTGNITGTQAAKMLLCILGYNASIQGYVGDDYWETNINVDAAQKHLYDGLENIDASAPLTRDQAAQMIWNALNAYEVEYITTLVTGPNGELTSKVTVQDKIGSETKTRITLLEDKYEAFTETAYMTEVSYESIKGEYTYKFATTSGTFNGDAIPVSDALRQTQLTTTQDFTDLFGQKVTVIYKDDRAHSVYGMYAESDVLATDIVGNITDDNGDDVVATNKQIKISDVKYNMKATIADANVYVYNEKTSANDLTFYTAANPSQGYQTFDAIDHDGDGKIDCFVIYPVKPADVTYVGPNSINAGGSYSLDKDTNLYGNSSDVSDAEDYQFPSVSKDQWVAIDQYNVGSVARKVSVLEQVQGEVTAMRGATKSSGPSVRINGAWYEEISNAGDSFTVGDTVALTVIGNYYFDADLIDAKTLDDVLMILDAGDISSGIQDGVEAKVMYAKDGSVGTISRISKVNGTATTGGSAAIANTNYESNIGGTSDYAPGKVVIGALYTYKEKDGAIELTTINSSTNQIRDWTFADSGNAFTVKTSSADAKVNGIVISDEAVVMAYNKGTDKYTFTTGAALKNWKTAFGDTSQYLTDTINGVETVVAVALYANATAIPTQTGTTGYGYVTSSAHHIVEDDTHYAEMSIWTVDGTELKNVKAEGIWDDVSSPGSLVFDTPSDSNVKTLSSVQRGAFVSFEKLSNGNIGDVKAVATSNIDAMSGVHINRDGDKEAHLFSLGSSKVVTKDTQIVYVNTLEKAGGSGDGDLLKSLAREAESTKASYIPNVVYVVNATNANELDALFIDVNGKIEGAPIVVKNTDTGSVIANALQTGDVTTGAATISSAVSVPANRTLTLTVASLTANAVINGESGATLVVSATSVSGTPGLTLYSNPGASGSSNAVAITGSGFAGTYTWAQIFTQTTSAGDTPGYGWVKNT